jgi:hypothetical protein
MEGCIDAAKNILSPSFAKAVEDKQHQGGQVNFGREFSKDG